MKERELSWNRQRGWLKGFMMVILALGKRDGEEGWIDDIVVVW